MKNRNLPGIWRQRGIDSLVDDFISVGGFPVNDVLEGFAFSPTVDVEEKGGHYLMSFDLPGVKKEDVKIEIRGDQLIVSGERKLEKKDDQKGRSYYERSYGSFQRSFTLPTEVKPEQIEADYRDGVLSIAVPKGEVSSAVKSIPIGEGKSGILGRLLGHKGEKKVA